jgi:ribonuclease D
LKTPLTQSQINYAALDIRMPLALRLMQLQILVPQQLLTTATIEFDALGSYTDMHLTGQNLDDARWQKRIDAVKARRIEEVKTLDEVFIPIVGK